MSTAAPSPPPRRGLDTKRHRAAHGLPPAAGLLGVLGILDSAAAAHLGGGSIATTGGLFLLMHAAAVLGLASLAGSDSGRRYVIAGWTLVAGTLLFSGDLILTGLYGLRPFPPAAPAGGLLLIAGWLVLPLASVAGRIGRFRKTS